MSQISLAEVNPKPSGAPKAGTAKDVIAMLRRHYIADEARPAGIFAPEITAPGSTGRRADLIWLGCTAAAGSELVGHEVKVTRSDLLTELADLTKSDPWQRYCDRWWLVIPYPALVEGLTLPESWGVLAPPSGRRTRTCTVVRPAPKLTPDDQAVALRILARRLHWSGHEARVEADRQADRAERLTKQVRDLDELVPGQYNPRKRAEVELIEHIVRELGGASGRGRIGQWPNFVDACEVVEALRDLAAVKARRDEAERTLRSTNLELTRLGRMIAQAVAGEVAS